MLVSFVQDYKKILKNLELIFFFLIFAKQNQNKKNMKKGIVILSTLLLTCFTGTSAQEKIDFYDVVDGYTTNGYVILRAEDGTPSDEVRLVGRNLDMNSISTYYGREEVPDEVTHEGKTYKVVEFGYFDDIELSLRCLKFGKNMRKVNVSREDSFW